MTTDEKNRRKSQEEHLNRIEAIVDELTATIGQNSVAHPRRKYQTGHLFELLDVYCFERGILTDSELVNRLSKIGYKISPGALSRYRSGQRMIPIDFLDSVRVCLDLSELETGFLQAAFRADQLFTLLLTSQ